ncbi:MAG: hypothetical protein ACRDF8_07575, partial [Chloroflexota bacterium]
MLKHLLLPACVLLSLLGLGGASLVLPSPFVTQPSPVTELYFTSPGNLPSTVSPGHAVMFEFTIHNLEQRTTTYNVRVSQSAAASTVTLHQQSVTLPTSSSTTIQQPFTIPSVGQRVHIEVD